MSDDKIDRETAARHAEMDPQRQERDAIMRPAITAALQAEVDRAAVALGVPAPRAHIASLAADTRGARHASAVLAGGLTGVKRG